MNSEENTPWQYKPEAGAEDSQAASQPAPPTSSPARPVASISWTASEYIDHHHGSSWYGLLTLLTLMAGAAIYLLTKDYFATGTVVVVGIVVGVFASRKPRQITYELNESGLSAGDKQYDYSLFKSFAVLREGGLNSINLFPLKRLMPPISAYFEPKDEEKIVSTLGNYLPQEERKPDSLDRLSRRLRL